MGMKNRVAAGLLAAVMGFSACGYLPAELAASAETDKDGNEYREYINAPLTYWLYEDHAVVADCETDVTEVEVPAEVEGLPVTVIGDSAFGCCEELEKVTLPQTITELCDDAFCLCYKLASIDLPEGLRSIGYSAFFECYCLDRIDLPASLETIGNRMLWACYDLTEIRVDENNPYFCSIDGVLYSKDTKQLLICPAGRSGAFDIPDHVTEVGAYAFEDCQHITSITMHEGLEVLHSHAFEHCWQVEEFVVPEGVTTIENGVFSNCVYMKTLSIPSTVTSIGEDQFWNCSSAGYSRIEDIIVAEGNPCYSSRDGVLFSADGTELIAYPGGNLRESYTVPEGVVKLCDSCFTENSFLKELYLPASLEDLSAFKYYDWDLDADVYFSKDNPLYSAQDRVIYNKDMTELLICLPSKKDPVFTVPDTVRTITNSAFWHTPYSLESVILPEGLEVIEGNAMVNCHIRNLTIPASVKAIGENVVNSDTLEQLTITGNPAFADDDSMVWNASIRSKNLKSIRILSPDYIIEEKLIGEDTIFSDWEMPELPDLVIYAEPETPAGDAAAEFAEKYGYQFKPLSEYAEPAQPLGDVNGDGAITASDAADVLIAAAAIGAGNESGLTDTQLAAADVNGDGAANASDAAVILMYAAAVGAGQTDAKLADFV